MNKINVQILFFEDEYNEIKKEADKHGLTVPLYIKSKVLKEDELSKSYEQLIDKVNALPSGVRFNIRALFGVEWTIISKGVKLNLGKIYFQKVQEGIINNVTAIGKDSSNVMWYEKK